MWEDEEREEGEKGVEGCVGFPWFVVEGCRG